MDGLTRKAGGVAIAITIVVTISAPVVAGHPGAALAGG